MAYKELQLSDFGSIKLYKRRGSRSLRLSISSDGTIRLTMPPWVTYGAGLAFIKTKKDWIMANQDRRVLSLQHRQRIGKAHMLNFVASNQAVTKSRIKGNEICVFYPKNLFTSDPIIQKTAQSAVRRALKLEADSLLPQRLRALANAKQLSYSSVRTRQLKSRWGSCNQKNDIVLNIFLLQLPWHLIDYVLLHELTHTKILHHGPKFWLEFESHLPDAKKLRTEIRKYQPNASFQENAYAEV